LSGHETFALLIDCVWSGGTGKPAVVYEGRAESCPSGFFYGSRARPLFEKAVGKFEKAVGNYSETTEPMESR
jgi:hypothetical protein